MRKLILPFSIGFMALVGIIGAFSENPTQWLLCGGAIAATVWILGGRGAPIPLLWICGMFWLQVAADVLGSDLIGVSLSDTWLANYRAQAILYCLAALLALATGMRFGAEIGRRTFRYGKQATRVMEDPEYRFGRLLICYLLSWAIMPILGVIANAVPGLAQPIYTFGYLHYAVLFLIAIQIFEKNSGYLWLLLIAGMELALGMISFFAAFKEPIFIILLAFASSRRRNLSAGAIAFGVAATICVVWLSLIWTVVKPEYRQRFGDLDFQASLEWMSDRVFYGDIDYGNATHRLVDRIGYTKFLSQILQRSEAGLIPTLNLYEGAVEHVLRPRMLFPDKAVLNDSVITTALLGTKIDEGTSIGVGYIAEAFVDFGFPLMLIPVALIGTMLGWMTSYFLTRRIPDQVRHAIAISMLFTQFSIAANINKALGGAIVGFIGIALLLKYGYPVVGRWLAAPRVTRSTIRLASVGKTPP